MYKCTLKHLYTILKMLLYYSSKLQLIFIYNRNRKLQMNLCPVLVGSTICSFKCKETERKQKCSFLHTKYIYIYCFPGEWVVQNLLTNAEATGDACSISRSGRPLGRTWQPTPLFFPRKCHEQRSLAGYSTWICRVRHDWLTENTCKSEPHI